MNRVATARRLPVAAAFIAGLALQGCAGPAPSSSLHTAADDPCRGQREELKGSEDYFLAAIGAGAVAGAAVGLATGSPLRALIGAAAGAAAGGIGGYYMFKTDNIKNKDRLVSSIHDDLANENYEIDNASGRFEKLAQCRLGTAQTAKADFQAGRISREEADGRLTKARTLFAEDAKFAEDLGGKIQARGGEFEFASNDLLKDDPAAQKVLEERRKAAEAPAAVPTPAPAAPASAPAAAAPVAPAATAETTPSPAAATPTAVAAAPPPVTRTVVVALPPQDVAGLAQLTDTNRVKRRAFSEQVTQVKATAENAFNIDAKISRAPAATLAG